MFRVYFHSEQKDTIEQKYLSKMLCDNGIRDNSGTITTPPTTTVEQLCDDILLEVFSHLNAKDLKNAALVARRWNELIGLSALTMRKFRFRIENERHSRRNHHNFFILTTETTDWATVPEIIQLYSVKSLHIQGGVRFGNTINSDEILSFLSRLPELEELSFANISLIDGTDEVVEQIEMPKLKTIRIFGDDFTILRHINAKELQQLQCFSSQPKNFEWLAESIVRFTRVQSLTLWNCMEVFEHINLQLVKCQLKYFEVYHINVSPIDAVAFENNLRQFLLLQAGSLSDLKFDCSMMDVDDGKKMVNDLLRIAFNKCTRMTSLDIRNLSIPREGRFYQSLSPNCSIRRLQVHWGFDGEVVEGLLKICPDLTRLEADMCHLSGDDLNTIAKICPKLVHLHTFKLAGCIDKDVIFEHLKYLSVSKMEPTSERLLALMAGCPKLEHIRIDDCSSTEFLMDAVIWSPTMKRLMIADNCYEIVDELPNNGKRRLVRH